MVISQNNTGAAGPFAVQMVGGKIINGRGGTVFSDNGGSLTLDGVSFVNNFMMALVSVNGGAGALMATNVSVGGGNCNVRKVAISRTTQLASGPLRSLKLTIFGFA